MKRGSVDVHFLIAYGIMTAVVLAVACYCVCTLKHISEPQASDPETDVLAAGARAALRDLQDVLEEREIRSGLSDEDAKTLSVIRKTNEKRFRAALKKQDLSSYEIDYIVDKSNEDRRRKLDAIREEVAREKALAESVQNTKTPPKDDKERLLAVLLNKDPDSLTTQERKALISIMLIQTLNELNDVSPLNQKEEALLAKCNAFDWTGLLNEIEAKKDYQNQQAEAKRAQEFAESERKKKQDKIDSLRAVIERYLEELESLSDEVEEQSDARDSLKLFLDDLRTANGSLSGADDLLYQSVVRMETLEKKETLTAAEKLELDDLSKRDWSNELKSIRDRETEKKAAAERAERERQAQEKARQEREAEQARKDALAKQKAEEDAKREAAAKEKAEKEAAEKQAKADAARAKREQAQREAEQRKAEEEAKRAEQEAQEKAERDAAEKARKAKMNYQD